jgi:hypothetical protein
VLLLRLHKSYPFVDYAMFEFHNPDVLFLLSVDQLGLIDVYVHHPIYQPLVVSGEYDLLVVQNCC